MVKRVTGWLNRAQDVYVAGETTPACSLRFFETAVAILQTGRPIYTYCGHGLRYSRGETCCVVPDDVT